MKYTAFKKHLQDGVMPIYLFEGEEAYFCERAMELLSAYITEPSLNYSSFDGASVKNKGAEDFISAAYSYPFMSEKRLVKVSEYYPTEREFERVKEVFENPSESTIVAIVNSSKPKSGSFELKKHKNVTFVDCSKAEEEDVVKWIFITLKRAGIYADASVCNRIASYCGMGMSRVSKEVEKLIAYAGEGGSISDSDVEELVFKEADYKLYELTGAVARGNNTLFIQIMSDMLDKGYDEMSFLSALGSYYKNLYDALISPYSDSETAKALNQKEYAVKKNREQARRIGKEKLAFYIDVFYRAVADIKCGNLGADSSLKTAVAKIFF